MALPEGPLRPFLGGLSIRPASGFGISTSSVRGGCYHFLLLPSHHLKRLSSQAGGPVPTSRRGVPSIRFRRTTGATPLKELRAVGVGIVKVTKTLGIGVSAVQCIDAAAA